MKIQKILIAAAVLLVFGSTAMFANRMDRADRRDAAKVLKRTALVLSYAQKEVKQHRVYTGDLAKAYRHQQFAKQLYGNRSYDRAVRQSLRARQLAWSAIKANNKKGRFTEDYDRNEKRYSRDMKIDDVDRDFDRDYDKKDKRKPADKEMTDEKIVNLTIEAEFK